MKTNSNSSESNQDTSNENENQEANQTIDENEEGLDGNPPANDEDEGDGETDTHDKFGYEKPKDGEPPKEEKPKTPEELAAEEAAKKKKKVAGYGEGDDEVPPAKTPEELAAEEAAKKEKDKNKTPEELAAEEAAKKLETDLAEAVKDLDPKAYDQEGIKKFAKENKLTPDQVKAYVKMVKDNDANALVAEQNRIKEQRTAWNNELKSDPEFGGANFDTSLDKVEKLMEKYMPDTKKVLTEKGGMLPPYFMRDFLRLAKAMNPTTKFVGGNPPPPKEEPKNFLEDLYQ
jgi:hypothetical protein